MERKQNNIETDDLEHQIDMMVYELYGLSQKEILIFLNRGGLSMENFKYEITQELGILSEAKKWLDERTEPYFMEWC